MSVGIGTALAIGGIASAAGSLGGAALSASAANKAANAQSAAAQQAQQLQAKEAQDAITEQKAQLAAGQQNLSPYEAAGTGALGKLTNGPAFQAPTAVTEQNDPGYQFRLQQGQQALENSAAAHGSLLSGGTAKSLQDYAQGQASNEYGNVYNRALQTYGTNQNTQFALAGLGANATSQANALGANEANQVSNIDLNTGQQQGQDINNAAAARASGYANSANAYGGAITGIGNNISQGLLLASRNQPQNNLGSGGIYNLPIQNQNALSSVYG